MLAHIRNPGTYGMSCTYAAMPTMPVAITMLNQVGLSPLRAPDNSFLVRLVIVRSSPARLAGHGVSFRTRAVAPVPDLFGLDSATLAALAGGVAPQEQPLKTPF